MNMSDSNILAPLDGVFQSYEEAYNALKQHGIQNGYGFRIHGSRPYGAVPKTRYYYCCDRARNYKSQVTIQTTHSYTIGCTFSLVIF
jgi:hypothetical protein